MNKLISVITSAENNEKYLNQSLDSLFKQTHENFEAVILHSNISLLKKHLDQKYIEDNRFRYIELPAVSTIGSARNIGLEHSQGEYIYFFDSDDYIPEKTLQILHDSIGEAPIIRGHIKAADFSSSSAVILPGLHQIKTFSARKFNLIKNNSALNFLISKEIIDDNNLQFNENLVTYSDLTFMVPLLEKIELVPYVGEAIYFRRRKNDPINNPSLRQLPVEQLAKDLFSAYNILKSNELSPDAEKFLDNKLLNFYRRRLITEFKDDNVIDYYFEGLSESISKIDSSIIQNKDFVLKNDVRAIKTNKINVFKTLSNFHHFLRDIYHGFDSKKGRKSILYKRFFSKLKLKNNLVVFESFQGKSYSDSPKYIYQYMLKNDKNYEYVWVKNNDFHIPGRPKTVKRASLKYYYYIARAKYIVSNVRMPNNYIKRSDQVFLQTWHGTPLKRLAGDMEDVHMPGTNSARYKRNFNRETSKWDYLIAPNQYSADIFKRAFWFDNTMLNTGYPRNDVLTNNNDVNLINSLKKQMNLPSDKKVILYAPTWRDDEFYKVGKYRFTLQLDLQRMKEELGDDYIILLRMHYVVSSNIDLTGLEDFAYDFSSYNDISELYLVSDILITDYSSVFFDYANLKRPILFYTYDIEKYQGQLRGFYIDMAKELPGPLLSTNDEVLDSIKNIQDVQENYNERYTTFYNRFCSWDDGKASEKVFKDVFEK
ncbi:bifunctional glycosyltransferase/CDP-glycerol:glycerophosphate glycerophosphotransferase [Corticicoccus populi]|uniref:CDP-glycerol glycerophosphotransferase family protein n=1 Tax=Corticicoccus populi TaxID=1812821 RepID=A0ABW5WXY9_9STAP